MTEQVKKIIEGSGNNLHFEVVEILERNNWEVEISPYYVDDLSGKPREVDIIARREIGLDDFTTPTAHQTMKLPVFWAILCIECKHLKDPVVFWMHKNSKYKNALASYNLDLEELLRNAEEEFHYKSFGSKVAKLYDTTKDQENNIFNAITQPIKSLLWYQQQTSLKGIYYPIFIYDGQDKLHIKDGDAREDIIIHLNYVYKMFPMARSKSKDFYVDILHKTMFEDFLNKKLEPEILSVKKAKSFDYHVRSKN